MFDMKRGNLKASIDNIAFNDFLQMEEFLPVVCVCTFR